MNNITTMQLSTRTGIPVPTIGRYCASGLMGHIMENGAGGRLFDREDVACILACKLAFICDFAPDDVRALVVNLRDYIGKEQLHMTFNFELHDGAGSIIYRNVGEFLHLAEKVV